MKAKRFGVDGVRQALADKAEAQGLRSLARDLGFSPAFISQVVSGRQDVTEKLARAIGFEPCPREYTRSK